MLGGICVYTALFTTVLRDLALGPHPTAADAGNFTIGTDWLAGLVLGLMLFMLIFLLISGSAAAVRRLRPHHRVCARCGLAEGGPVRAFSHVTVAGTAWEEVTCPRCGTAWYARA